MIQAASFSCRCSLVMRLSVIHFTSEHSHACDTSSSGRRHLKLQTKILPLDSALPYIPTVHPTTIPRPSQGTKEASEIEIGLWKQKQVSLNYAAAARFLVETCRSRMPDRTQSLHPTAASRDGPAHAAVIIAHLALLVTKTNQ